MEVKGEYKLVSLDLNLARETMKQLNNYLGNRVLCVYVKPCV